MTCCELHCLPSAGPNFANAVLVNRRPLWQTQEQKKSPTLGNFNWQSMQQERFASSNHLTPSGLLSRQVSCRSSFACVRAALGKRHVFIFPSQSSSFPLFYGRITMTLHEFMSEDKTILKLSFSIFNVIPRVVRARLASGQAQVFYVCAILDMF